MIDTVTYCHVRHGMYIDGTHMCQHTSLSHAADTSMYVRATYLDVFLGMCRKILAFTV